MWKEFRSEEFDFRGRHAIVVFPKAVSNGKLVYKTEYWNAFPDLQMEFLKNGYYLCHLDHEENRWGAPGEISLMADFIRHVTFTYSLEQRCILIGMSAGGLQASNLTINYPELVSALYLDAPVMNLLSIAGLGSYPRNERIYHRILEEYGFDDSDLVCFRESPVDKLHVLTERKIPAVLVYGGEDEVVCYRENGELLERAYDGTEIPFKVICKPNCGHHPHGVENNQEIIDFLDQNCL